MTSPGAFGGARQITMTPFLGAQRPQKRLEVASAVKRRVKKTEVATDELVSNDKDQKSAKLKMLHNVVANINLKHGEGALMSLGDKPLAVAVTPSGCLTLDRALGGGYPKGRIVEIFGPESSGKTTLALHAIAEVQKAGGNAVFIDAEHAFDQAYAKALGIDTSELLVSQPDHGEMAFNILDELVRSGSVDVIVVDSVSALTPRSEVEGDIGTPQVGAQARLMSLALRKVAANASKSNCTIIFINQLRYKVGVLYGNPETTSGGQALKFYSSVRLDIRSKDKVMSGSDVIGNRVRVKVVKNKVAPPFETAEFDMIFGHGIDALGCVLDAGEELDAVVRKGSYYYFNDLRLGQGREKAIQYLRDNDEVRKQIESLVNDALMSSRREGAARPPVVGAAADDDDSFTFDGPDGDLLEGGLEELEQLVSGKQQQMAGSGA